MWVADLPGICQSGVRGLRGILGVRHDDGVVLRAEVGLHALAW